MEWKEVINLFNNTPLFQSLLKRVREAPRLWIEGVEGAARSFLIAGLREALKLPILVVIPTVEESEEACEDISTFSGEGVYHFPAWEILPSKKEQPHQEIVAQRLEVLERLLKRYWVRKAGVGKIPPVVVTPLQGLLNKTISPSQLEASRIKLEVGREISLGWLVERLCQYGYQRVPLVERWGEFSQRGGILDIYTLSYPDPLRVEFFGDKVESIRQFDVITQRSVRKLGECTLLPSQEASPCSAITDYFPEESIFIFDNPALLEEERRIKIQPTSSPIYLDLDRVMNQSLKGKVLFTSPFPRRIKGIKSKDTITIKSIPPLLLEGNFDLLSQSISRWEKEEQRVFLISNNIGEKERLEEILTERKVPLGEKATLIIGRVSSGFILPQAHLIFLTDQEIFGRYKRRLPRRKFRGGAPISGITDLEPGDYVVHLNYGIGRFLGIRMLDCEGKRRCYLLIEYQKGDKLYVPVEGIGLIEKYVGLEGHAPQLSLLGRKAWDRTKEKVARAVRDIAGDLLNLYATRQALQGFPFSPDTPWQREFEASFIYEETPDQVQSLQEIKRDMESPRPMDRLLCGDVGYGKTEVAIRAAFKVVMDDKQVAVLVPTTVLAAQHYITFRERLADYPIMVGMLSRFQSPAEQKKIIENLKKGGIDIIIGTHRLLQKDVAFRDLGLVIIDEEQRFGVSQKEHLKQLRKVVDVLTLTATPIPRTLYMSLTGIRDMSTINTPPKDRLAVETFVLEFNKEVIIEAILRELNRSGQVFFVHNRVKTIDRMADYLRRLVPRARIEVAHGQMPEKQLERVMMDFTAKKIDVLVTTTIIESGLDIPNANTIIIDRADTFGLSDLYQLRGRVGRYKHRSYAYLLIPPRKALATEAQKRLKTIEGASTLGAGFKIALQDLEIRGAGNILGHQQHGYIHAVGFDLFCKLLRKAVAQIKGEELPPEVTTTVDLAVEAFIPEDYIPAERLRISIYKKIAGILREEEVKEVREELRDRFGPLPLPTERLFKITLLKLKAASLGVDYLGFKDGCYLIKFKEEVFSSLLKKQGEFNRLGEEEISFTPEGVLSLRVKRKESDEGVLSRGEDFLKRLEEISLVKAT